MNGEARPASSSSFCRPPSSLRSDPLPEYRARGPECCPPECRPMPHRIARAAYADIYGPTTGDRVRLGDTSLVLQVERDFTTYGEECKFGGGKVLREGMGQAAGVGAAGALDCVITNALVVDWTGV